MATITQTGRLNMIPQEDGPLRLKVSQWDKGSRILSLSLYAGQAVYTVPEGAEVTCDGSRADGGGFSIPVSAAGSTVTLTLSDQMTATAGETRCQITITSGEDILGSANFIIQVEEAPLPPQGVTQAAGFEELVTAAVADYLEAHPEAAGTPHWIGTEAAYEAMSAHDAGTVYLILEDDT